MEHTLQLAIQAILDVAAHIVSDDRLGEPRTNHELFDLLMAAGWIDDAARRTLRKMTVQTSSCTVTSPSTWGSCARSSTATSTTCWRS